MNTSNLSKASKRIRTPLIFASLVLLSGCTTVFDTPPKPPPDLAQTSTTEGVPTIDTLRSLSTSISGSESLSASIHAHRLYLRQHPNDKATWTALANQLILKGTAHTEEKKAKRGHFLEAMSCCESAMRLNPAFATARDRGTPVWEAVSTLGKDDMDPMLFWATAILYTFREGMHLPMKIANVKWVDYADQVLVHMETIDRTWKGGAIPFSRGIVKIALPRSKGGDREKGLEWINESAEMSQDWMLCHWGRAKYAYPYTKNRQQREGDLRKVISLDIATPREEPYWRRYFQNDARNMIEEMQKDL